MNVNIAMQEESQIDFLAVEKNGQMIIYLFLTKSFMEMNRKRQRRIHMDSNPRCIDTGLMNMRKRAEEIYLYVLWQICSAIGFLILGLRKFFLPVQKHRSIITFS